MKKIKLAGVVAMASMMVLAGCAQNNNASSTDSSAAVAVIGKDTITQDQLYAQLKKDAGLVTLRSMILQKVLEQNVSDAAALKTKADEEVAKQQEQVGGEEALKQMLAYQKLGTIDEFKQQVYIRELFTEVVGKEIDKSDAAIEAYYNNTYQPKMEAQHILVDTEEAAKAAIERLNNGETFEDLAKELSKDGSASKGGLLSPFTTGKMVSEFEEAVKAQKNGEVTQTPVKSKFGYHVIKTINNGEKKPLAEIKDEVTADYVDSKMKDQNFTYRILGKLMKAANVDIKDADLKDAVKEIIELADKPESSSSAASTSEAASSAAESSSSSSN